MPITEKQIDKLSSDEVMAAWCQLSVRLVCIMERTKKWRDYLEQHADNCDLVLNHLAEQLAYE